MSSAVDHGDRNQVRREREGDFAMGREVDPRDRHGIVGRVSYASSDVKRVGTGVRAQRDLAVASTGIRRHHGT